MSGATTGASLTAYLATVVIDDEHRRRAEGTDDMIDYFFDPEPSWGWLVVTGMVLAVAAAIVTIAWYTT